MDELPPAPPAIGLGALFLKFLRFGCLAFGGPVAQIAMVREALVEDKGGLLTFGGAYTAIPYVRDDTVGRGWISDGAFLDGVALAGLLPAPLVIFATFAGYIVGGWTGAIAITLGMFLPAFAFSMIFFERLEAIVGNEQLQRMLDGVAAAVIGIIAGTFFRSGREPRKASIQPAHDRYNVRSRAGCRLEAKGCLGGPDACRCRSGNWVCSAWLR